MEPSDTIETNPSTKLNISGTCRMQQNMLQTNNQKYLFDKTDDFDAAKRLQDRNKSGVRVD